MTEQSERKGPPKGAASVYHVGPPDPNAFSNFRPMRIFKESEVSENKTPQSVPPAEKT